MIGHSSPSLAHAAASAAAQPLSSSELYQLTLFKWRYSFEAIGFDAQQVRALMFLKWLYSSRRAQG